jgi:endonuclease/exonuclease/phosphatase family metal-dependent hydrolase
LPVELGGQTLFILRGWASLDITFKGLPYRFVNTHLEPADVGPGGIVIPEIAALQAFQAAELLATVGQSPYPVIMVGDFNSDDDGSTTATYQTVRDAGFVDAWLIGPPRGTGYTSNQAPDLFNATSQLFHRGLRT